MLALSLRDLLELVLEQGILLDLLVKQQANLVNLLLEALVFVVHFLEVLPEIPNLHLFLLSALLGGLAVLQKSLLLALITFPVAALEVALG